VRLNTFPMILVMLLKTSLEHEAWRPGWLLPLQETHRTILEQCKELTIGFAGDVRSLS
jgi:hypothetical protein